MAKKGNQEAVDAVELVLESGDETEALVDAEVVEAPASEWKDVAGSGDALGVLQAFNLGRLGKPGVLLRYVADGKVIMCQPYREVRLLDNNDGSVSLMYQA